MLKNTPLSLAHTQYTTHTHTHTIHNTQIVPFYPKITASANSIKSSLGAAHVGRKLLALT